MMMALETVEEREVEAPLDALRDELDVQGRAEIDDQFMHEFEGDEDEVLVTELVIEYSGTAPDSAREIVPADDREELRWMPVRNEVQFTKVSAESQPMIAAKRIGVLNIVSVVLLTLLAAGAYTVVF